MTVRISIGGCLLGVLVWLAVAVVFFAIYLGFFIYLGRLMGKRDGE
jgi:hypothetical protein